MLCAEGIEYKKEVNAKCSGGILEKEPVTNRNMNSRRNKLQVGNNANTTCNKRERWSVLVQSSFMYPGGVGVGAHNQLPYDVKQPIAFLQQSPPQWAG